MFLRTGQFLVGELSLPCFLIPMPGAVTSDCIPNGEFPLPWTRHGCVHAWVTVASVDNVGKSVAVLGQPTKGAKHRAPSGVLLSPLISPAQRTPVSPNLDPVISCGWYNLSLQNLWSELYNFPVINAKKKKKWLSERLSNWTKVTQLASTESSV